MTLALEELQLNIGYLTEYCRNAARGFRNLKRFDDGFCECCIFGEMVDDVGHDLIVGLRASMRTRQERNFEQRL